MQQQDVRIAALEEKVAALEERLAELLDIVRAHLVNCPGHGDGDPLP